MPHLPRTLIASLAVVAFMGAGWLASAEPSSANHAWAKYHWGRTSNPFTVKLVDSVTNDWNGYLTTASTDWSQSSVLDTAVVPGSDDATTRQNCAPVAGQVRVCNAEYGVTGWLGIASIWATRGKTTHITQGTVKNNDTYFNQAAYNTGPWRQFVMCQEIGHTFGLNHQNEGYSAPNLGSCMDYTNDPTGAGAYLRNNEHPNQHDYDQLATIYGHLDGSSTLTASAPASGKGNGVGAGVGGDPTDAVPPGASAKDGRVFVRDLGNGTQVISVVIWAEDFPGSHAPGRLVRP